ncbi:histidine phosphatase family protein [Nocardia yunnanensis]|uniref:Histidine phosphatase family protein n=1 Tax=Nocardia yunnanensis TaxID=2382165 RepID=A0A386ZIM5_9NOCA|nr:histidine phosphatase family protein [Nocardia yunnanensis]
MFGATSALAAGAALSACGGKKHDKPVTAPVSPPASTGTPPNLIMIIRHAEKPDGSGKPYGLTADGDRDEESLTTRGWTRAGALIGLFDPRNGDGSPAALRPGLARPATIFASNAGAHGSKRPEQTVTPLAAALGSTVDTRFSKGQEAELVAALAGAPGPVLISWQHENIGSIIAHLGQVTPTPPSSWPGERFDLVYLFTRNDKGWNFAQHTQNLLSGDSATPIS